MPWFVELDSNGKPTTIIEKASKSPGKNWLLVVEAQDYMTHDEVEKLVAAYKAGQNPLGATGPETPAAHSATPQVFKGLEAVGNFFNKLGQANTWIRVGEVTLGILLIISGLMKLTGANADIMNIVKKVPL